MFFREIIRLVRANFRTPRWPMMRRSLMMRLDLPMDRSLSSGMFQRRNVTWKAKGSVHTKSVHRDGSSRSHTNLMRNPTQQEWQVKVHRDSPIRNGIILLVTVTVTGVGSIPRYTLQNKCRLSGWLKRCNKGYSNVFACNHRSPFIKEKITEIVASLADLSGWIQRYQLLGGFTLLHFTTWQVNLQHQHVWKSNRFWR